MAAVDAGTSRRRRPIGALEALALAETQAWVCRLLADGRTGRPGPEYGRPSPRSILEVGCGAGDLAGALIADGHEVVALDADPDAVQQAHEAGVPAILGAWPDYDHRPFDAILFTRSLHHLDPLGAALDRAVELLVPGGRLIVEDFAYEEADAETLTWFRGTLESLDRAGLLQGDPETFVQRFLAGGGDPEAWRAEHGDHLHTAATMAREIDARFGDLEVESAPYLFRYLVGGLEPTLQGFAALRAVHAAELERVARGSLQGIGRRFAARRTAGDRDRAEVTRPG